MTWDLIKFALTDPATQWLGLSVGFGLALLVGLGLGTLLARLIGGRYD